LQLHQSNRLTILAAPPRPGRHFDISDTERPRGGAKLWKHASIASSFAASRPENGVRGFHDCAGGGVVYPRRMKRIIRRVVAGFVLAGFCLASASAVRAATEPTALELIKEGNRHVGEDAKDKVTQIRSEKSIGSLTPNIWFVVFHDMDAPGKATEVKFGAGRKLDVKRPGRLFERSGKGHLPLPKDKLRTDSDKALEIATKDPLLKNLKLTATRMTLERWEEMPVWKVRLWAAKLRNPAKDADIGEIIIAAEDGKVVVRDLRIDRVD
jgi:hypothetical protein